MDHVNNEDQYHQELESLETLSLTDFPLTPNHDHKHQSPPSPAVAEDLFEFCSGGSTGLSEDHMIMSHAEDMISGGKLIPIKDQHNHDQNNEKRNVKYINRARCESMRELKSNGNKGTASQLFRNSHSFDCKKLRNPRSSFEQSGDNNRNSLSTKSSSSRWSDLMFGPLKVPQEMDLKDIRNRQIVQNTSKSLFPSIENGNRLADHRKTSSWGVLGFLSCKRSGSVAVTTPFG